MITIPLATQWSDADLVSAVTRLVAEGRHRTADLIALLVALDTRTVHVEAGYASLFRFCVSRLRLSEEEAFYRIAASRVAARFPVVLERLRDGRLTLTAIALLRKHLSEANHLSVLEAAEGRSKREIQALVARLAPRPDVAVSIRRLAPPRTLGRSPEAGPAPSLGTAPTPGPAAPPLAVSWDEPAVSPQAGPTSVARPSGDGTAQTAGPTARPLAVSRDLPAGSPQPDATSVARPSGDGAASRARRSRSAAPCLRPRPPSSPRSRPGVTVSASPSPRRRTRSCAGRRICSPTPCRRVIPPPFSTGR